jgi:hypothetical protein
MELPQRLINISQLEENYTINIKDGSLIYHGLFSGFKRKLKSEDRNKTLDYIECTIDDAVRLLPCEIKYLYFLRDAKKGLCNLKKTYKNDLSIVYRIDLIILRIENACTRFERSIIKTIEQIPIVLNSLKTSVEVESLCLVRQTPIRSPDILSSINSSPSLTPFKTPILTPYNKSPTLMSPRGEPPITPPSSPGRKERKNHIFEDLKQGFTIFTGMPMTVVVPNALIKKENLSYPLPRNMEDSYLHYSMYSDGKQNIIEDVD